MPLLRVLKFKLCKRFELQHSFCRMVKMRMCQPIYILELDLSTKTYEIRYLDYTFKRKQFALDGGHCCFKTTVQLVVYLDSLRRINHNLLRNILNYVKSQHVHCSTSMFEENEWDISAPTDLPFKRIIMIVECMFACTVLWYGTVASLIATIWIQN